MEEQNLQRLPDMNDKEAKRLLSCFKAYIKDLTAKAEAIQIKTLTKKIKKSAVKAAKSEYGN